MVFSEFPQYSELVKENQLRESLELPDSVRLLERPVETPEQPETRLETRELNEGLELDTRTREAVEVSPKAPFEYSEAYMDSRGVYHPGQITGVYKDSMENPAHRETAESLSGWQHQEKAMSCAVQTQREIINKQTEANVTETELRELGKKLDLYTDIRGTYRSDVGKLAERYGLERYQPENATTSDLIAAKARGEDLIVAVDSALLERPYLPKAAAVNHVVEVLDFDLSDPENPKVILNDPGRMEGRGSVYPLSVFEHAACKSVRTAEGPTYVSVTEIHKKEAQ